MKRLAFLSDGARRLNLMFLISPPLHLAAPVVLASHIEYINFGSERIGTMWRRISRCGLIKFDQRDVRKRLLHESRGIYCSLGRIGFGYVIVFDNVLM